MSIAILRGDARNLPLPDESVDLIVCSPPYWSLRSYSDNGEHYDGQIGSEKTPGEWLAAMLDCTREWVRVLKPEGSIFVNLGDKYAGGGQGGNVGGHLNGGPHLHRTPTAARIVPAGTQAKSLLGLPWRYALACMDDLGLILRRDIVWHKANPLPESVTDRCATRHEYVFHLVKQPRYYAAVDEIREPHTGGTHARRADGRMSPKESATVIAGHRNGFFPENTENPLGKLPGSVWEIPSQPLNVPDYLATQHFAAFPFELPRRCILGWSPPAICLECDEGRRPVSAVASIADRKGRRQRIVDFALDAAHGPDGRGGERWKHSVRITGYACACAPFTDHPGTDRSSGEGLSRPGEGVNAGHYPLKTNGGPRDTSHPGHAGLWDRPKVGPWREYHLDGWTPPPSRPALVVDPFSGTGTTLLVADVLGRNAVGIDRSGDYCRLARWRTTDPGERARAMQVPKPPVIPDGQDSLFDLSGGEVA